MTDAKANTNDPTVREFAKRLMGEVTIAGFFAVLSKGIMSYPPYCGWSGLHRMP
jgi:hypothetical protein